MKPKHFRASLWLIAVLSFSFAAYAQTAPPKTAPVNVENYQLKSKLMAREMPLSRRSAR